FYCTQRSTRRQVSHTAYLARLSRCEMDQFGPAWAEIRHTLLIKTTQILLLMTSFVLRTKSQLLNYMQIGFHDINLEFKIRIGKPICLLLEFRPATRCEYRAILHRYNVQLINVTYCHS